VKRARRVKRSTTKQQSLEAGFSVLASKKFDGMRIADLLAGPRLSGEVKPEQFSACAERLLAMNDEEMLAEVAASPQTMMEIGSSCVCFKTWHEAMAEAHAALLSRIACCVAKNLKRLEAA
jgi:hypothetical protein